MCPVSWALHVRRGYGGQVSVGLPAREDFRSWAFPLPALLVPLNRRVALLKSHVLQRASVVRRDMFIGESVSLCTKLRQERHKTGIIVFVSLLRS